MHRRNPGQLASLWRSNWAVHPSKDPAEMDGLGATSADVCWHFTLHQIVLNVLENREFFAGPQGNSAWKHNFIGTAIQKGP